MHLVDWLIVASLMLALTVMAVRTARYARSVSGFLAANRCAGRYLISVAFNMAQLGVITLVWYFQQNYDVGFTSIWWGLLEGPALIVMAITGWVIYRFRRTRAMTMAQFFEMRYSRSFRVYAGLIAFLAGIVNYGIFPGVAARFFCALCDFPPTFELAGVSISSFMTVMLLLMSVALGFVFLGGQIAVMVTDFVQGVFSNFVFLAVILYLLISIPWGHMEATLTGEVWEGQVQAAPEGRSLVDPFDLGRESRFDPMYWVISVVILFYGMRAWQGDQGYNAAAINAHEARMANILNGWRFRVLMLIVLILPLAIRTLMHHPAYVEDAAAVQSSIDGAVAASGLAEKHSEALASELRTPTAASILLPVGLLGLFCAAMLGAFLSTNDTYLHSWGSIFVQDVVLPFRKTPLSPAAHLWLLRGAIFGVAIFAVAFSANQEPSQYIAMFVALTGAVFVGGAGSAIIGGLYWSRGTAAAAWSAMTVGLLASTGGILLEQAYVVEKLWAWNDAVRLDADAAWQASLSTTLLTWGAAFTGQEFSYIAIVLAVTTYIAVSYATSRRPFDLDRLLHRGAYETEEDRVAEQAEDDSWLRRLGFDREFTGRDRVVTLITLAWPLFWTLVFVVVTVWVKIGWFTPDATGWTAYWRVWIWFVFVVGFAIMVWFTIGGLRNLREMFARLRSFEADVEDDGSVRE